jgi:formylglycine-generating enzyme required for sulfatase activity
MKNILHPDYWVQIPEGEFLTGMSDEQRMTLWLNIRNQADYSKRTLEERKFMDSVINKLQRGEQPNLRESKPFGYYALPAFRDIPPIKLVWLKRFYIARFPITRHQLYEFLHGTPVRNVPGALEKPETKNLLYHNRASQVRSYEHALAFCEQINGRLPDTEEWEKAARGTDGRLYPWGNEWNPEAGFFFYGQKHQKEHAGGKSPVDAYPQGVSPYGVWAMAGGLPELVIAPSTKERWATIDFNGKQFSIGYRGHHPRKSNEQKAHTDHIVAHRVGRGDWVTFRPVLDKWPKKQWRGINTLKQQVNHHHEK